MADIIEKLHAVEELARLSLKNPGLNKQLYAEFRMVSMDIAETMPAYDIKNEIGLLLESFEKSRPDNERLLAFILRIRQIISHLQQHLPLGISNAEQLREIREIIIDALKRAVEKYEKNYKRKLPDISDTRIFIVGSRARGYSHDLKSAFAPGRDVDCLLVGRGIFESEIDYMQLKGFKKEAERSRREKFIIGGDNRFVPPYLGQAAEAIKSIFKEGDNALFEMHQGIAPVVNFHIGMPDSRQVVNAIKTGIECR